MCVSDYGKTQACCLYLFKMLCLDTLKLKSTILLEEELKVNSQAANVFREPLSKTLLAALEAASIPGSLKKGEKGEMDTLTLEWCNLLVVGGRSFLQVCKLKCKNASCKGTGLIITKPKNIIESHYSPCSDQVSHIQIYPSRILVHLKPGIRMPVKKAGG